MISSSPPVRSLACLSLLVAACSSPSRVPDALPNPPTQPPAGRTPVAGWEGKLISYDLTSTVTGIASRTVTVLVPPGYPEAAAAGRRFPVMVMHDGNNCLDHDPFGHGGWQVHTIAYDLTTRGLMAPAIFVLVDNDPAHRGEEYVPGMGTAPGPTAEAYLDFLEKDVLPFVDARFWTAPGARNRVIGGSSYGGIISLYAAWTRPAVWGTTMGMSTAFAYDLHAQVDREAPPKKPLRIYIDSGTVDWSGGDDGLAETIRFRDLLQSKGWTLGVDLMHVVGDGHNHSEDFWRARLPGALPFLFPPAAG